MTHDEFMQWKAETSLQDVIESCCNSDKIVVEFNGSTLKWWKEAAQNKLLTRCATSLGLQAGEDVKKPVDVEIWLEDRWLAGNGVGYPNVSVEQETEDESVG